MNAVFQISWKYTSWVCCKCGEVNEKGLCWVSGHKRCNSCQDGN